MQNQEELEIMTEEVETTEVDQRYNDGEKTKFLITGINKPWALKINVFLFKMAELDKLIDEWEAAVLIYDEQTRTILRRIRLYLAQVPDDILEEALDDCCKL